MDRLWPRGVAKKKLEPFYWAKEITPSTELRKWFGHKEERFDEFKKKYLKELDSNPAKDDLEFSLHDANIIDIYKDKNDLILESDYGFVDLRSNMQVDGNIRIQEISLEDSYVYLLTYKKVLCGNLGKFTGEKMTLKKFLKKFQKAKGHIDIIDEYHAYQILSLGGFFTHKSQIKEIKIDFFYRGDIVYQIEE